MIIMPSSVHFEGEIWILTGWKGQNGRHEEVAAREGGEDQQQDEEERPGRSDCSAQLNHWKCLPLKMISTMTTWNFIYCNY